MEALMSFGSKNFVLPSISAWMLYFPSKSNTYSINFAKKKSGKQFMDLSDLRFQKFKSYHYFYIYLYEEVRKNKCKDI